MQKLRDSKHLYKYTVNKDILREANGQRLRFFPGEKGRIHLLSGTQVFTIHSTDDANSEIAYVADLANIMKNYDAKTQI